MVSALHLERIFPMKQKTLYLLWGLLYVICTGLGFVAHPEGAGRVLMILSAVIFFIPGFYLLLKFGTKKNRRRIRILSVCSLSLTLLFLVANILSVAASKTVGLALHVLLSLVSTPMLCGQHWLLSLFLWACLLMLSLKKPTK